MQYEESGEKKPSYFEYSQFVLLSFQIYHCYAYSENNALNNEETVLREEHMYLEAALYHTNL